MPWVRVDDQMPQHPKVAQIGPLGLALQVAGLCYCNRYLTDGFIPLAVARTLLDFTGIGMREWHNELFGGGEDASARLVIQDLLDANVWEQSEGGYIIHDYLDYQLSKVQILTEREKTKKRVQQYRNAVSTYAVTPLLQAHNAVTTDAPTPTPTPTPKKSTPHPTTPRALSLKKVGDTFRQQMIERFGDTLSPEGVNEAINDALSHKAVDKWKNIERYVQNWLRKEVERHGNNARQPTPSLTPPQVSADFAKYQ